jgi:hypothetical protein
MDHYDRMARLKRKQWWPLAQRAGERLYSSGVRRVARELERSRIVRHRQGARIDNLADTLMRISQRSPYLSAEPHWQRRTEQLMGQIDQVRRFLG